MGKMDGRQTVGMKCGKRKWLRVSGASIKLLKSLVWLRMTVFAGIALSWKFPAEDRRMP